MVDSRRKFIGKVASSLASTLAMSASVLGANDRVRLGVIGCGARGAELARQAAACPGVEVAACADVYQRRLEDIRRSAPNARTYADHRRLLDEAGIDAVAIATPQHLHAEHFLDALAAAKHIYVERAMAFTLADAKRMRAAFERDRGRHTVAIGHQPVSSGQMIDALAMLKGGAGADGGPLVGRITAIRGHMYRNTPRGKATWLRPVYPDMTPETIGWREFLGNAPAREFDAFRYVNWRLFADYSGGNVHESMSQMLAFWYKALNLAIPRRVTMTGGVYLWKDGREAPDTMHVSMEQPEEMLVTWDSSFGNNALDSGEQVLGTDGTIFRGAQIRYAPQKVNRTAAPEFAGAVTASPLAHMQNFIDCIRAAKQPNCPFELGFRVSVACHMAVESYRLGRAVSWDAVREELV
jgi:predicted dehydrogenase